MAVMKGTRRPIRVESDTMEARLAAEDEPTFTVRLTAPEARALRLASIFGGPAKPHESLESARTKLREAEAEAFDAAKSRKET